MGVPHDGLLETLDCPGWHGYLMSSALNHGRNSFQWSNCSLQHLYTFLRYLIRQRLLNSIVTVKVTKLCEIFSSLNSAPEATCLQNQPRIDKALPRLLPGRILTLDEQCEKVQGTRACDVSPRWSSTYYTVFFILVNTCLFRKFPNVLSKV